MRRHKTAKEGPTHPGKHATAIVRKRPGRGASRKRRRG